MQLKKLLLRGDIVEIKDIGTKDIGTLCIEFSAPKVAHPSEMTDEKIERRIVFRPTRHLADLASQVAVELEDIEGLD